MKLPESQSRIAGFLSLVFGLMVPIISFSQQMVLKEKRGFSFDQGVWNLGSKETFNYGSDTLPVTSEGFIDSQGNLELANRNFYTYNIQDKLIKKVSHEFGSINFDSLKSQFTYTNNRLTSQNDYYAEAGIAGWKWDTRIKYFYHTGSDLADSSVQDYKFSFGWTKVARIEYQYSASQKLIKTINYDHLIKRNTDAVFYTYNPDGTILEETMKKISAYGDTTNSLKFEYDYDVFTSKSVLLTNPIETKVRTDFANKEIYFSVLLPKPSSIDFQVFNAAGSSIYMEKFQSTQAILNFKLKPVFPSGVYLFKVQTETGVSLGKILISN